MFLFIHLKGTPQDVFGYLNTSYVLIYPFKETDPTVPEWDLNTSYVLIYRSN